MSDTEKRSVLSKMMTTWQAISMAASDVDRSRLGVTLELVQFCLRTGLGPMYFLRAGMYRPDFPKSDKFKHISDREYHAALDKLNPLPYRKLTQYKLSEKALYRLLNIPSAEFLLYYSERAGVDKDGSPIKDRLAFEAWLEANQGVSVCVKPLELWGGNLVITGCIERDSGKLGIRPFGDRGFVETSALMADYCSLDKPAEFIVEYYIQQAPSFSRYNSSSVNTVRLWVLENEGDVFVMGAYLRVGRAGCMVDNGDAGGILFPIDMATGTISPGFHSKEVLRSNYHIHPDSTEVIAGTSIEHWKEICEFGCDVVRRLPGTRFAGLDVALTESGPLLIETNAMPDRGGASFCNIPTIELKRCT